MTVPASKTAAEYAQDWADDIHNQTGKEPAAWEVAAYRAVIERAMAQEHARGRAEALDLAVQAAETESGEWSVQGMRGYANIAERVGARIRRALASSPPPPLDAVKPEQRDVIMSGYVHADAPTCRECGAIRCRPLAGYSAPPHSPDGLFCPNCGEVAERQPEQPGLTRLAAMRIAAGVQQVKHEQPGPAGERYLPWPRAGGPNECAHGYAAGIPCPDCDTIAVAPPPERKP
jgi:hypothetical protein